jgi:murein DD-endopeptidase MepM/ murein hydrolase activator NlpD
MPQGQLNLEIMKQKREKTTILLVSKNAGTSRQLLVSTYHLKNWKKYLAAVIILFLSLLSTIFYLFSERSQQEKEAMALSSKLKMMHQSFTEVDTSNIKEKFVKIDTQLAAINGFLKSRGISSPLKEPEGGEVNSDIISTDEVVDFYEKYLKKIVYNISYTPIGMPFHGSITSDFGHRENPFGGMSAETHKGLDIKGPMGAPVKAMAKGEVIFAGVRGGFGNCVILKHGNGFETLYGHLSRIAVRVGKKIQIGQQVGNIGSTGRSTGPHLHYEVRRNGRQINPEPFLTLN